MTALAPRCEVGGGAPDGTPFNNCGEGALMASLAEAEREPVDSDEHAEIDLRGARPAPAACAALCVALDGRRRRRRRWFVGGDRTAARIRRRAGDDGRNPQRRHQHDTRRHPTTSVSFWEGDR